MDTPRYAIDQRNLLPNDPGVYRYYNQSGELIYVGKAKNIKNVLVVILLNLTDLIGKNID